MSKKLILLLATGALLFVISPKGYAETTNEADEPENTIDYGDNSSVCQLRVERGYNVRSDHNARSNRCTTFQSVAGRTYGSYTVKVIGSYGSDGNNPQWIKFTSDETKDCPGGAGWAYYRAFNADDVEAMTKGECGRGSVDMGRGYTPPPDRSNGSDVNSTNRNYRFPLDKCYGIKHDGGGGDYGDSRAGGRRTHAGVDYYAPMGTQIYAPCDGQIFDSKSGNVSGNMLRIRCTSGETFTFMHMHTRPPKARNGRVSKGGLVGGVGNTGNARRQHPHLHLEITDKNGRRYDPDRLYPSCNFDSNH